MEQLVPIRFNPKYKTYDLNSLMPVGKYQGQQLKRIPTSYLCWILKQNWFRKGYSNVAFWIDKTIEACKH